jgi:hypothetical protein
MDIIPYRDMILGYPRARGQAPTRVSMVYSQLKGGK